MPVPTSWHPGEIEAQQARGYEDAAWGVWMNYEEGAPSFMVPFLQSLPFLSVTTLDQHGRPWSSLICNNGQIGFLELEKKTGDSIFKCTIKAYKGVPIRECLLRLHKEFLSGIDPYEDDGTTKPQFQLAAVGVMLNNRRRNKLEGVIVSILKVPQSDTENEFVFRLQVSNTFGNCPKYINTRQLMPLEDDNELCPTLMQGDGSHLPAEVVSILSSADALFLATKHSGNADAYPADPPRAGNNIRGGPSGFLRIFWDDEKQKTCIVLPDWSGNRLMQSFGNMMQDPMAGIAIPVWSTESGRPSDVLHLTCSAQVLANEEASRLIRGVQGAVKLWPQEWTLLCGGVPLMSGQKEVEELNIGWSPYNPPLRLLNTEKPDLTVEGSLSRPTASLVDAHFYSPIIATFTFRLDYPLEYTPGQHIVLDCYHLLDTRVQLYTHMAQFRGGEKDLNDDGTRSWTISYASQFSSTNAKIDAFELTLRRKDRGGITPGLFQRGKMLREAMETGDDDSSLRRVQVEVLGIEGFSLIPKQKILEEKPLYMAYLLSGIGLTPMLPHLSQIVQSKNGQARVLAIIGVKWHEVEVTKQIIRRALSQGQPSQTVKLHLRIFLLAGAIPDGAANEEEQQGYISLPSNVSFECIVLRGKRLQPYSLSTEEKNQGGVDGFVLPHDAKSDLEQASQVVICAGNLFSKQARNALKQAGIADDKIKNETFSF